MGIGVSDDKVVALDSALSGLSSGLLAMVWDFNYGGLPCNTLGIGKTVDRQLYVGYQKWVKDGMPDRVDVLPAATSSATTLNSHPSSKKELAVPQMSYTTAKNNGFLK